MQNVMSANKKSPSSSRLRYDVRRLGRATAASILHGTVIGTFSPTLVDPAAAEV
jgi:hypothetical protein